MGAGPRDGHTQTLTVGRSNPGVERAWVLRVIDGPDRGATVRLSDASVLVGAATDADLVLKDAGVSRRHLELAVVQGGVRVVDLGSKNGTRLLGARLSVAVVGVGAELVLGQTTLRVDDEEAQADAVEATRFGALSTRSTDMARAFGMLGRAASTDVPVLLEGEAGTGKGGLARMLHASSPRAGRAFVEIDVESAGAGIAGVLFGLGDQAGALERAHGGTLFIDEIGALPPEVQPLLARAVHSGVVVRPGDRARRVNVRVVTATVKDADGQVKAGRLRAELRDVLAVVRVRVPPLRERVADIPELARALLAEHGRRDALDAETLARLGRHRWPLNLRELRAVLGRAVAASGDGPLAVALDAPAPSASLRDQRANAERDALVELLERNGGNVSAAARDAGYDWRHLHRLLKKHGLRGG